MPERIYTLQSSRSFLKTNADPSTTNGCEPLQIPTFLKVGALLRLVKRSGINKAVINIMWAAVSRFKFRLWICRRSAKIGRTAGLNKAIINVMWVAVSRFKFAVPTD